MIDLFRTTAVRWALGIALWSTAMTLALFGFVYWQTAPFVQDELAHVVRHEVLYAAQQPDAAGTRVEAWIREDLHSVHFGGVFGPDGSRQAGNIDALPRDLPPDGEVRRIGTRVAIAGQTLHEELWSAALTLPDGRVVVVAHDTDEIDRARSTVLRALGLALVPMLALSALGGTVLAARGRRRVVATQAAVARLMHGHLNQRLPVHGTNDEFDRLARDVNTLLDEIGRLMEEVRGVGDAVAHDLRTPLTRLRTRLETSRERAESVEEFREAIDQGLAWIDQTLAMVNAVLRIGEIEHGRRRAAFARLDLAGIVAEVAEFHEPVAEEKGVSLRFLPPDAVPSIEGDRDLLFEALSNLVENAVKFTPPGGEVRIGLHDRDAATLIAVEDTGPGVPERERAQVFGRFHRSEPARGSPGNGLGLSLVSAVAQLHGLEVGIGEAPGGGCRVTMVWRRD
ncbi:HAMP domain-containing protein [Methylobacterium sp. BTF04]|uniref:sensor histidine kinase n=1 Tax=Methylobacterium sp. BTF04 TaxID=2708300 RepID=UPI0013D4CEA2|nr:ATP-binding protein [Methylobacterium sp. BTF04]NEU12718.1 HAMP domain-containing protein [Methylobacterium sp. BTF04]